MSPHLSLIGYLLSAVVATACQSRPSAPPAEQPSAASRVPDSPTTPSAPSRAGAPQGTTASVAPSTGPGAAPGDTAGQQDEARSTRLLNLARRIAFGGFTCPELASEDVVPLGVCKELQYAVDSGRTRRGQGRRLVRQYLHDLGLRKIRAHIVAYVGDNRYEVAKLGYNSYFDISYPTDKHFLVETVASEYVTTGRFKMWVRGVGTETILLKNGFTDTWDVYRESILGQLWQEVRDARAGKETSDAARVLLQFLALSKGLSAIADRKLTDEEVWRVLQSM